MPIVDKYRADIDGLRAVAILPVILFHMGVDSFTGGFIGVDIFFVISGFLITSIVLPQLQAGTFSLLKFYERRARRILPALVFMVLLTAIASYYILFPHQIKDFSQSIAATALFLSNYFFYLETDYFNPFTNHAPLLHTWSLAVEEQFYIFYPVLLILLCKLNKLMLIFALAAIGIVSFVSSLMIIDSNATLAFYSIHTRAWELMIGALAAISRPRILAALSHQILFISERIITETLLLLSAAGIAIAIFAYDSKTQHPAFPTLIPVLATCAILIFGDRTSMVNKLLSLRPVVWIGLLSYSLYIFHQPVVAFVYHLGLDRSNPGIIPSMIAITTLISLVSYFYVEKPLRYTKTISQVQILSLSSVTLIVLVLLGYYGHLKNGFMDHFIARFENVGGSVFVDVNYEKGRIEAFRTSLENRTDLHFSDDERDKKVNILILGDSMGDDAYLALSKMAETVPNQPIGIKYYRIDDECIPRFIERIAYAQSELYKCEYGVFYPRDLQRDILKADKVVLAAKWQEFTYNYAFDLANYIMEQNPHTSIYVSGVVFFSDMSSMALKLAKRGIPAKDSGHEMFKELRFDRLATSDKLKKKVVAHDTLKWIDKFAFFCNNEQKTCKLFDENSEPIIWDNAHLSVSSYTNFGHYLAKQLGLTDRTQ